MVITSKHCAVTLSRDDQEDSEVAQRGDAVDPRNAQGNLSQAVEEATGGGGASSSAFGKLAPGTAERAEPEAADEQPSASQRLSLALAKRPLDSPEQTRRRSALRRPDPQGQKRSGASPDEPRDRPSPTSELAGARTSPGAKRSSDTAEVDEEGDSRATSSRVDDLEISELQLLLDSVGEVTNRADLA